MATTSLKYISLELFDNLPALAVYDLVSISEFSYNNNRLIP